MNENENNQENENNKDDKYIDDILNNFDENDEKNENNEGMNEDLVLDFIVSSIAGLLEPLSKMSKIDSLKLSLDDQAQLKMALKPFAKDLIKYLYILKYAPILIFVTGYLMRVMNEVIEKRKQKKVKNVNPAN